MTTEVTEVKEKSLNFVEEVIEEAIAKVRHVCRHDSHPSLTATSILVMPRLSAWTLA